MTTVTIPVRFRVRRRTAADWTSGNEVLLSAEIGLETDTNRFKFGDGSTAWNSLAYYSAGDVPITDAGGYFTGTDVEAALQEIGLALASVSSDGVSFAVAQVAHGFVVGQAVQLTGSSWALADRDAGSTVCDGIVSAVADADNFTVAIAGKVTLTTGQWDAVTGGSGGLTAGDYYWTSGTAGGLSATQPTGIAQNVGVALSTTVLVVRIGEAIENVATDPELAAIAGLTSAANKGIQFTGSGTAATFDLVLSGTYTPTLTNTTNIAASTAYTCHYFRIGNHVFVFGRVDVDVTAGSVATLLGLSLPIASNFAAATQLAGTAAMLAAAGVAVPIIADATNDRASFSWVHSADTANRGYSFSFAYLVI